MNLKNSETLSDWNKWKSTLSKAINFGQTIGLSEGAIDKIALKIGNILTATIDPENKEERLLQELWKVGDDKDRKVLSKLIVKMIEIDGK